MGKPMIFHVINRVLKSKYCDEVLIATTNRKSDDKLEDFSKQLGLRIFRGSTNSVLSRFYEASKCFGIDIIIRITADDPFKDPYIIDQLIDSLISNNYDYVCNNMPPTYPEGLDTEVFTFKTLEKCFRAAKYNYEIEHVTPYIRENKNLFSIWNLCSNIDLSKIRLTVDTKDDLFFAKKIYETLCINNEDFTLNDIISLLNKSPQLMDLMPIIERDAGLNLSKLNEKNF